MITNILAPLTFFSVDDNPDLCMTESCGKKKFSVPLIIALIVMFLIFLGYWILMTIRHITFLESF